MPLYLLVKLLYDEAEICSRQVELISEMKLRCYQRRLYKGLQEKTFHLWAQYRDRQISKT